MFYYDYFFLRLIAASSILSLNFDFFFPKAQNRQGIWSKLIKNETWKIIVKNFYCVSCFTL